MLMPFLLSGQKIVPEAPPEGSAYETLLNTFLGTYTGACWPLDDAVASETVRELTETYAGTPSASGITFQSDGPTINGEVLKSATFASGSILIPYTTAATSHTFSVWFNTTTAPDSAVTYCFFDTQTGRLIFGHRNTTHYIAVYSASWQSYGSQPSANNWHHIAFVANGSSNLCRVYVDGSQLGSDLTYTSRAIGGTTRLGAAYTSASFFAGRLAYAALFDVALSESEVIALYNGYT